MGPWARRCCLGDRLSRDVWHKLCLPLCRLGDRLSRGVRLALRLPLPILVPQHVPHGVAPGAERRQRVQRQVWEVWNVWEV